MPRFVSIKSDKVNVRQGPGMQYPIKWVFTKKNEPVKVLSEIDNWRQIVDVDGEMGWVHYSFLAKKRFVVVSSNSFLSSNPRNPEKSIIAEVEKNSRCGLMKCKHGWCKIECDGAKEIVVGWIQSLSLWGLHYAELH